MLWRGAIDDSADRDREKVIISSALIGDKDRWTALHSAWQERLAQAEIAYFRSSDCRHLRGQFFKYRDLEKYPPPTGRETADQIQEDLDQIIRNCRLLGVATIIPVPIYEKLQSDPYYAGVRSKDPYHWALQTVWMQCAQGMSELGRGNVITLAHDECNNFPTLHELYKGYKNKNRKTARIFAGFAALDARTNPTIQAADVAASVVHRHAMEWIDDPSRTRLKRLKQTMYRISIWDEYFARLVLNNELKLRREKGVL